VPHAWFAEVGRAPTRAAATQASLAGAASEAPTSLAMLAAGKLKMPTTAAKAVRNIRVRVLTVSPDLVGEYR
jgi:hypothetical protein